MPQKYGWIVKNPLRKYNEIIAFSNIYLSY